MSAPLTQARLHELLHYDPLTGVFTWKVKASIRSNAGDIAGTPNTDGYLVFRVDGKLYYAHRLAWLYVHGVWPARGLDHENGRPGDNWLKNLRPADQSQNNQNAARRGDNTSGTTGVDFYKAAGMWRARITSGGVEHLLGLFETLEEARQARIAGKQRHHEFQPTDRIAA